MTGLLAILVMIGILSILILVHEFGHFSVARFFGFQTPVFGFGLPIGPSWAIGRRWGTEFRIHALMLGGYVAIPELGDESAAKEENYGVPLLPFRKFPIWQRALVAVAGVTFNVLFAYLVMLIMYISHGEPHQPTVVHSFPNTNPIARQSGIRKGDIILTVDKHSVSSPDEVVHYLVEHPNTEITFHVFRPDNPAKPNLEQGHPVDVSMTTNEQGKVGMALVSKGQMTYTKVEGNFFEVARAALVKLYSLTSSMLEAMGMMVQGMFSGGGGASAGKAAQPQLGIEDLHGVLAVIKIGADIAQSDWSQLYLFTIMISLDLAIINLVPWPALDGGHLAFMLFEAIRGRPMAERAQGELVKWGMISLLVLMAVIMVNDVRALITGKLDFKSKDKQSAADQNTNKDPDQDLSPDKDTNKNETTK